MEALILEDKVYDTFSDKQKLCYVLCGRVAVEDCKSDMGLMCELYKADFDALFESERIDDLDPDAWMPEVIDEEDEDEFEDDLEPEVGCENCDEELIIKVQESASSIYDSEDT